MSEPDTTEHEYGTEPTAAEVDPILELRLILYGLGLLVLLMSLSLNLYIRKQNRNIETQVNQLRAQIQQIEGSPLYQQNKNGMQNLLEELKKEAKDRAEAAELLKRYGIEVQSRPPLPDR
jgi:sensor histidine kinase YesM